jgi:hypothetical protein
MSGKITLKRLIFNQLQATVVKTMVGVVTKATLPSTRAGVVRQAITNFQYLSIRIQTVAQ